MIDAEQSADELGLLAGHRCYENRKHEDCPFPPGSDDALVWLNAFCEAFDSAEANDEG